MADKRYSPILLSLAAGAKEEVDFGYIPDAVLVVPKEPIQGEVRVTGGPSGKGFDYVLRSTASITIPGGNEKIWLENAGTYEEQIYIFATKGYPGVSVTIPGGLSSDTLDDLVDRFSVRLLQKQQIAPLQWFPTGSILWQTSFENGGMEVERTSGAAVYTTRTYTGGTCIRMVTTATLNNEQYIQHWPAPLPKRVLGMEAVLWFDSLTSDDVRYVMRLYQKNTDGDWMAEVGVQRTGAGNWELFYVDSAGADQVLANPHLDEMSYPFHLKMIADFSAGTYKKVILNDNEYTLSAALKNNPALTGKYTQMSVRLKTLVAAAKTAYLDDLVLTDEA